MSDQRNISEAEIQAYVDNQLDARRHAYISAYLKANPAEAQRVEDFRRQNELMHALFDGVLDEAVPAELPTKPHVEAAHAEPRGRLYRVAASIGWLAAGGVIGWVMNSQIAPKPAESLAALESQQIIVQAATAYAVYTPEVKHPVEVGAQEEAHLVKWLSKRLKKKVTVPNLNPLGYHLVGGRLLPSDTGPAAMFMYENATKERLTLYVRTQVHDNKETAFRYHGKDDINIFYWIDGSMGYALSGKIDKKSLLAAARTVYQQISL